MTPRYRCPFCGSFTRASAKDTRKHILQRHRMLLIEGLGLIEAFTTRNDPIAPYTPPRTFPKMDSGVSGEGDS